MSFSGSSGGTGGTGGWNNNNNNDDQARRLQVRTNQNWLHHLLVIFSLCHRVMLSGGVKATRAGEQEAGGGEQTTEGCYRGDEEAQCRPGETTEGRQQQGQQLN